MITEDYGLLLKKLMKFTNAKSYTLASYLGYDMSYISKWCTNAKLPAARSTERIHEMMGEFFSRLILEQQKLDSFCTSFSVSSTDTSLKKDIARQLTDAYQATLKNDMPASCANTPSKVLLTTGSVKAKEYMTSILRKLLQTASEPTEITIYGEFCQLHSIGFWKLWEHIPIPDHCPSITIHVGLCTASLRANPTYITALYMLLNRYLDIDFVFYDFSSLVPGNLILCKNTCMLQFAALPDAGISFCAHISCPSAIEENYEKFTAALQSQKKLISCDSTFYTNKLGGRFSFYDTNQFFFFLTNSFEYLLPHSVFKNMLSQADDSAKESLRRLCITWEEIINKSALHLLVPTSTLMRYLETGYIDLSGADLFLTEKERIEHIHTALQLMKENRQITFGILNIAPSTSAFQNTNISFYSNYKSGFFKKNPLFMQNKGTMFYMICDDELHQLILQAFQSLQQSPQYQQYSAEELAQKYELYKPLIERTLSS